MREKVSGIYLIINTQNGIMYIGSSGDIYTRWTRHRYNLRNHKKHNNQYLQRAWDKYGEGSFNFCILCQCPEDHLLIKEKYWIEFFGLKNLYNLHFDPTIKCELSKDGRQKLRKSRIKGRKFSEETKARMSRASKARKHRPLSEETKRKIGQANKGKVVSEETKVKMAAAKLGTKRGPMPEETKQRISQGNSGKVRTEECNEANRLRMMGSSMRAAEYCFKSPTGEIFRGKNIKEFAKSQDLKAQMFRLVRCGKYKQYKGWISNPVE